MSEAKAREIVADWMILRGYNNWHGETVQALLFEIEAQAKGRGEPPEPPPGEGDWQLLRADAEKLRADLHATLRAVIHHFGPQGAQLVTERALAERAA